MTTIRCIDVETTGIPTPEDSHAIVEIGWCDLTTDPLFVGYPDSKLCNPGRPIPTAAMAVHHITDEMVADAVGSFADVGEPDYFAAHNADFERQFIDTPIPVICTWKVALRVYPESESHSLQYLRYELRLKANEIAASPPHRAGPDAYLCALLLERMMIDKPDLTLEDMVRWSSGHPLLPRCPLFKHKGKKWEDVPTDYLDWIVNKPNDVDVGVKANAKHHLKARAG
jgi:exodeoxyribonuclease X